MKNIIAVLSLSLLFGNLSAQSSQFNIYKIGDTNCSVQLPAGTVKYELKFTGTDSVPQYVATVNIGDYEFGVILERTKNDLDADYNQSEEPAENLLHILDFLKDSVWKAKSAKGYTKGLTLDQDALAEGFSDVWTTQSGNWMTITGWIEPNFSAILWVTGKTAHTDAMAVESYLNGIVFPDPINPDGRSASWER